MTAMWGVVSVLFYLAIYKRFKLLLLVPIAFGALVANLPTKGIIHDGVQADGTVHSGVIQMEATFEFDRTYARRNSGGCGNSSH